VLSLNLNFRFLFSFFLLLFLCPVHNLKAWPQVTAHNFFVLETKPPKQVCQVFPVSLCPLWRHGLHILLPRSLPYGNTTCTF